LDDSHFDLRLYFKQVTANQWAEIEKLAYERFDLGFLGQLPVVNIDKYEIQEYTKSCHYTWEGDCLTFHHVNSIIADLFPANMDINLIDCHIPYHQLSDLDVRVKNIRALIYLIRNSGF
jgi:hypothetical protein